MATETTLKELDSLLDITPLEIMEDFFQESLGYYLRYSGDEAGEALSMKYNAVLSLLKIFKKRDQEITEKGSRKEKATPTALEDLDDLLAYIPFDTLAAYLRESFEYYIQYSQESGEPLSIKYYTIETLLKILKNRLDEAQNQK